MVWKSLKVASPGVSVRVRLVLFFGIGVCTGFHRVDITEAFSESDDEYVGTNGVASGATGGVGCRW